MSNEITATVTVLPKKEVRNISKAIKHHVRSIQRRLKRVAKLDQKQESKLASISEPATFCDRVRVEDHFAQKETKQVKKIERHRTKVQKLSQKLATGGVLFDLPEEDKEHLQQADSLIQNKLHVDPSAVIELV